MTTPESCVSMYPSNGKTLPRKLFELKPNTKSYLCKDYAYKENGYPWKRANVRGNTSSSGYECIHRKLKPNVKIFWSYRKETCMDRQRDKIAGWSIKY